MSEQARGAWRENGRPAGSGAWRGSGDAEDRTASRRDLLAEIDGAAVHRCDCGLGEPDAPCNCGSFGVPETDPEG